MYDRLVLQLTYKNTGQEHDHNIVAPVLKKQGVCEGFTCLFILAMRRIGIPCIRVSGFGHNEHHCWNMVWLCGEPCHVDLTWEVCADGHIMYRCFNLTDEEISRDHKIFTEGLPPCTCTDYGWHNVQRLSFADGRTAARHIAVVAGRQKGAACVRLPLGESLQLCVRRALRRCPAGNYTYVLDDKRNTILFYPK